MWCLIAYLLSAGGLAQTISFGFRGGVPLTAILDSHRGLRTATGRYVVGPTIEIELPHAFAVSADLLYQRAEFGSSTAATPPAAAHRGLLPILLRHEFVRIPGKPFVSAGVAFNRVFTITGVDQCGQGPFGERFYCISGSPIAELRHRGTHGAVIATGLRVRQKVAWLVPELRLIRWGDRNFGVSDSAVRSNLTEVQFLLGVRF
jgi:hypothetical protein